MSFGKKLIAATRLYKLSSMALLFIVLMQSAAIADTALSAYLAGQQHRNAKLLAETQPFITRITAPSTPVISQTLPLAPTSAMPAFHIRPPTTPVLIFVSFSMPMNSLRAWEFQAQKIHAPLIIRGLVDNNVADTSVKLKQLFKSKTSTGLVIDPVWFTRFHIRAVPAVVVGATSKVADVVYGDSGLFAALQQVAQNGSQKREALQLLQRWQGAVHA